MLETTDGRIDVGAAWSIVELVLREHVPEVAESLRPPATDEQLHRLAEAVGGDLPDDLVASLRIHDGQDDPSHMLGVYDDLTFLGCDAMLEDHAMRIDLFGDDVDSDDYAWMTPDRVRTIPNSRGWLRCTRSQAYGHAVDLDPLPAGRRGQIIWLPVDGPTPVPEAESYGQWLAALAARLDAGAFTTEPGMGIWLDPEREGTP